MIATLIPFFLIARLAVDDAAWKFGPEYVYDVRINTSTIPEEHGIVKMGSYISLSLLCRPKMPDALSCYVDNSTVTNVDNTESVNSIGDEESDETTERKYPTRIPDKTFLVKFNERGVESVTTDQNIFTLKMNLLRNILDLLSFGASLNGKPDGVFTVAQNFSIGECEVDVKFNHFHARRSIHDKSASDRIYELVSLPPLNKVPGEVIELVKTKKLDDCSNYASNYIGTYGKHTVVDKRINSHLTSSTTHMLVTDKDFAAITENDITFDSPKHGGKLPVSETITLVLKEIRGATSESYAKIENPGVTSILMNDVFKNDTVVE